MSPILLHFKGIKWGLTQISKGKYLLYFVPGVLIGLLFWNIIGWSNHMAEESFLADIPWIGDWISSAIKGTFNFMSTIFNQIFIFFVLTVLSPMNTYLSEQVEGDLIDRKFGFDLGRFIGELFRMCGVVFLAIVMELTFMGIYAIISWIFGLDLLDPFVYFIIAAFFYGFSFYDYSLERHDIGVSSSIKFAFKNWQNTLTTGAIFMILLAIPIFGVPIASVFITILSTFVFLSITGAIGEAKKRQNETI